MVFEPRLGRLRLRLKLAGFEPRLRLMLSLLSLKNLYTKFHLKCQ
jgi:hypothetical protein